MLLGMIGLRLYALPFPPMRPASLVLPHINQMPWTTTPTRVPGRRLSAHHQAPDPLAKPLQAIHVEHAHAAILDLEQPGIFQRLQGLVGTLARNP